ncbi:MAG: YbhB/YbcL family Raf kinase inhibitor-like protein [Legionellales bacterium]|nr:YbhB/YbcL family Raf kinase inhibitor-like protein [Legionellales bacterium]|tara:strand:+ start:21015 stop:21533 length:519 start_codon:yes stop_codon:yes gene_type:complete
MNLFRSLPALVLLGLTINANALTLTSSAFNNLGTIPREYTCQGADHSPPLSWQGVPEGTKSFALIMNDPTAKPRAWDHWVVYNIPGTMTALTSHMTSSAAEVTQGLNSWRREHYDGPCPPSGRHRYNFMLYALDKAIPGVPPLNKAIIQARMRGHVLAEAELSGYVEAAAKP